MAVDNSGDSADGRIYVTWTDFSGNGSRIRLAYSSDQGQQWATTADFNGFANNSGNIVQCAMPAVGPDGTVYVAWYSGSQNNPSGVGGLGNIEVSMSTNSGHTFDSQYSLPSFPSVYRYPIGSLEASSYPTIAVDPNTGYVYLAWIEDNNGIFEIYFSHTDSPRNYTSWTTPILVTQPTSGSDFMPWLTVNSKGVISLIYYQGNSNSVDVFSAQSFNGGQSFSTQVVKVTSASGNPSATDTSSDYIGVTSDGSGEVHALWTDFRSGTDAHIYSANFNQQPTVTLTNPTYIDAGGSGAYYLINGSQSNSIQVDLGTSITLQPVPQNSDWAFAGWDFGSYSNPVAYYPTDNVSLSANLKELQHSMDASADSDNSQRKFIRVNATGYLFQTYDDGGHAWLEYSTNGGSAWNLANYDEPLDYDFTNGTSPGSKGPSLSYYDQNGYDVVAAAIEEPNSSGHYSIYLDVFYYSNGSYQPFGPQWIDDEPDSTYFADANPNVVLNGPDNNSQLEFIVTFEKSTVNGQAGIGCKAGVLLANCSYEVSQLTPAQLVDGTDSYSQDATVYAN